MRTACGRGCRPDRTGGEIVPRLLGLGPHCAERDRQEDYMLDPNPESIVRNDASAVRAQPAASPQRRWTVAFGIAAALALASCGDNGYGDNGCYS
jgi:hypothetical protein